MSIRPCKVAFSRPGSWSVDAEGTEKFVIDVAAALSLYPAAHRPRQVLDATAPAETGPSSAEESDRAQPETAVATEAPLAPVRLKDDLTLEEFHQLYFGAASVAPDPEDLIVVFGFYFERFLDREDWSILDVSSCFALLGLDQPKNLVGLLSMLARTKKRINQVRPGQYRVADRTREAIEAALTAH